MIDSYLDLRIMVVKKRTAASTTRAAAAASAKPHAGVGQLHATKNKAMKAKSKATPDIEIRASKDGQSNVLYIGHLPHGFFEKQMKEFFGQFGTVTNIRLSRSKKTAKSKGYAFLQFQSVEVASIAAEAMDGYHMFGQKLVVKTLKKEDVHPEIFNGANRVFKRIPWREIEAKRHNKERNGKEEKKRASRARRAAKMRTERIAAAGIDYVFSPDDEVSEAKKVEKTSKKAKKIEKIDTVEKTTKATKTTKTALKTPRAKVSAKAVASTPSSGKKATPAMTRSRAAKKR